MSNSNKQKRKIVYRCSYCDTLYENADICPGCNAPTAESVAVADNLDTILERDITNERTDFINKGTYSAYTIISIIHLLSCGAFLFGFIVSPLMLLVHIVYHLVKRKKPQPVVIIDIGACLLMTILFIYAFRDIFW